MKITVTKKDIKRGTRGDPGHCPIALACKRLGLTNIVVGDVSLGGKLNGEYINKRLSRAAQRFVARFDHKKPVNPFTFIAQPLY